tara:strand:+ start:479 stop:679 length:201 start_codon:yes stop_codon:yes gene_type:complete
MIKSITFFKKILLLVISILFLTIFAACEDDPILDPQDDVEEGGSYAKLSLPEKDHKQNKKRNPKIY